MTDYNGKPQQFVDDAIRPALVGLELDGAALQAPIELMLGTALQESGLIYRVQLGGGPALGLFQMEPNTHDDIWANFLQYRAALAEKVRAFLNGDPQSAATLRNNDRYAAAMTRVHYFRMGKIVGHQDLPAAGDIAGMARYWKDYYNTAAGAGTAAQFVATLQAHHGAVPHAAAPVMPTAPAQPDIDALNLEDYVRDAAYALRARFPDIVFTSGRRDMARQASAMAGNVTVNRQWIAQTYKASPQRDQLQAWVDSHPGATSRNDIAAGLLSVMSGWTNAQLGGFSRHISGEAFDVRPVGGSRGDEIKAAIRALPKLELFLEREGGLTIWHAQFKP